MQTICLAFHQLQDKTENRLKKYTPTLKTEAQSPNMNIAGDLLCIFSCSLSDGSFNEYLWRAYYVVGTGARERIKRDTTPAIMELIIDNN